MSSNSTLAKRKSIKVVVKRVKRPYFGMGGKDVIPRFVEYHALSKDFQTFLLAALGFKTKTIARRLDLTEGQVQYRITKAEKKRRKGDMTQRTAYRDGTSDIANTVINMFSGGGNAVHKEAVLILDKRGLYAPKPRGVLVDDRSLPKRS